VSKPDTLRVISQPEAEPVTLAEAKMQLAIQETFDEFDSLIADKIAAGRRYIEKRLGQTLVATQYRATWAAVPAGRVLHLPHPPLLTGSVYDLVVTVAGDEVDGGDLEVDEDAMPARVTLPSGVSGKVVATYWAGVEPGDPIEPPLKAALLMFVEHTFKNRGIIAEDGTVELPQAFDALLASSSHSGAW
jgi:uncharacterized phiE125 gp8 family phage protein